MHLHSGLIYASLHPAAKGTLVSKLVLCDGIDVELFAQTHPAVRQGLLARAHSLVVTYEKLCHAAGI